MADSANIDTIGVGLTLDTSAFDAGLTKARSSLAAFEKSRTATLRAPQSMPVSPAFKVTQAQVRGMRVDINQHMSSMAARNEAVAVPVKLGASDWAGMRTQIAQKIGTVPISVTIAGGGNLRGQAKTAVGGATSQVMAGSVDMTSLIAFLAQSQGGSTVDIGRQVRRAAASKGITGRAAGGPVSQGRPYLVGEEGPEIIVPDRPATVIPTSKYQRPAPHYPRDPGHVSWCRQCQKLAPRGRGGDVVGRPRLARDFAGGAMEQVTPDYYWDQQGPRGASHRMWREDMAADNTAGLRRLARENIRWPQAHARGGYIARNGGGLAGTYADWLEGSRFRRLVKGPIKPNADELSYLERGNTNVRSLLNWSNQRDPSKAAIDRAWYELEARKYDFAGRAAHVGIEPRQFADVVALLSDSAPWDRNAESATGLLSHLIKGKALHLPDQGGKPFITGSNIAEVKRYLAGEMTNDDFGLKRGQFAKAFYDPRATVVDRWQGRATTLGMKAGSLRGMPRSLGAGGSQEDIGRMLATAVAGKDWTSADSPQITVRRASEFLLEQIADEMGYEPRGVQAQTWVAMRDDLTKIGSSMFKRTRSGVLVPRMAGGPMFRKVGSSAFYDTVSSAAEMVRPSGRRVGETVHVYSPEEYAAMRTYLNRERTAGYGVKDDGDLVSVFNVGGKGAGKSAIRSAIQRGATKLDAFDEVGSGLAIGNVHPNDRQKNLPRFYGQFGFREVGRDPWNPDYAPEGWRGDTPDVVYMEREPFRRPSGRPRRRDGGGRTDRGILTGRINRDIVGKPINYWNDPGIGNRTFAPGERQSNPWLPWVNYPRAAFRDDVAGDPLGPDARLIRSDTAYEPDVTGEQMKQILALFGMSGGLKQTRRNALGGPIARYRGGPSLGDVFPGGVELGQFGRRDRLRVGQQLLKLGAQFPFTARRMRGVSSLDAQWMEGKYGPNVAGAVDDDIDMFGRVRGRPSMYLNASMNDADIAALGTLSKSIPDAVTHEFGHAVDYAHGAPSVRHRRDAVDRLTTPSGYGNVNRQEKFAELFLADQRGGAHPLYDSMRTKLFDSMRRSDVDLFEQITKRRDGGFAFRAMRPAIGSMPRGEGLAELYYAAGSPGGLGTKNTFPGADSPELIESMHKYERDAELKNEVVTSLAERMYAAGSRVTPVGGWGSAHEDHVARMKKLYDLTMAHGGEGSDHIAQRQFDLATFSLRSEKKGLYDFVNPNVMTWATGADQRESQQLARVAAERFGLDRNLARMKYVQSGYAQKEPDLWDADPLDGLRGTLLEEMYSHTQERLRDFAGDDSAMLRLYRGVALNERRFGRGLRDARGHVRHIGQPMSSWTSDPSQASGFAHMRKGGRWQPLAYAADVPMERVLSTPHTGFGALREHEFVVLGGDRDWVRAHPLTTTDEGQEFYRQATGLAGGGEASRQPYLVGELQPELFVPDRLSYIIPPTVMDKLPKRQDGGFASGVPRRMREGVRKLGAGILEVGSRGSHLFEPPEDGWIIPHNLTGQVSPNIPRAHLGSGPHGPRPKRNTRGVWYDPATGYQMTDAAGRAADAAYVRAHDPVYRAGQAAGNFAHRAASAMGGAFQSWRAGRATPPPAAPGGAPGGAAGGGAAPSTTVTPEEVQAVRESAREAYQLRKAGTVGSMQAIAGRTGRSVLAGMFAAGGRQDAMRNQAMFNISMNRMIRFQDQHAEALARAAKDQSEGRTTHRDNQRAVDELTRLHGETAKWEKKLQPSLRQQLGNFGAVLGSMVAYSVGMKAVGIAMATATPTIERWIDSFTGFRTTNARVTASLAPAVRATGGRVDQVVADRGVQMGLSGDAVNLLVAQLSMGVVGKAAAMAQGEVSDLFKAAAGNAAATGLYGGYGGVLGSSLLAEGLGGGRGFTQTIRGSVGAMSGRNRSGQIGVGPLQLGRPEEFGEKISLGLQYITDETFRNGLARLSGSDPLGDTGRIPVSAGGIEDYLSDLGNSFAPNPNYVPKTVFGEFDRGASDFFGGVGDAVSSLNPFGQNFAAFGQRNSSGVQYGAERYGQNTPESSLLSFRAGERSDFNDPYAGMDPQQAEITKGYLNDLGAAADRAAKATGAQEKVTWELTNSQAEMDKAARAALSAGDYEGFSAALEGIVVKVNGEVADTGEEYKRAVDLTAKGRTIPDLDTWAKSIQQSLQAGRESVAIQAQDQIDLQIPANLATQLVQRPFLDPSATLLAANDPLSAGTTAEIGGSITEIRSVQEQLQAEADAGFEAMKERITDFSGAGEAAKFAGHWGEAVGYSKQIAALQTRMAQIGLAQKAREYANNMRLATRALADAEGMAGRGGSAFGQYQRQDYFLGRQSQALGMGLQQKQINFQVATAGFSSNGMTAEEVAARQEQAKVEASYAQQQLDIDRQRFDISLQMFNISSDRAVTDARASRELLRASYENEKRMAAIVADIATKEIAQSQAMAKAQSIFQGANNTFASYLSAATNRVAEFGNTVAGAIAAIKGAFEAPSGGGGGGKKMAGAATGYLGSVNTPTSFLAGEAGPETVLVLRNPRSGIIPASGGGGGGGATVTLNVNFDGGVTVRDESDIARIAAAVESRINNRVTLLGLSRPSGG